jgi:hypothetical protein
MKKQIILEKTRAPTAARRNEGRGGEQPYVRVHEMTGCSVLNRQHPRSISVEAWNKPGRECTVAGACATPNRRVG